MTKEKEKTVEELLHNAGFQDIWYAHPGPRNMHWRDRWHAGLFTGPQNDLICVKHCDTNKECEKYLSPGRSTIRDAITAAVALKRRLGAE